MTLDKKRLRLLLKDCANGFYQQMYFWGKDVIHPSGNQLQAHGFKKSPSTGLPGTSCYTLQTSQGTIELYGSCAGFYTDSSNFVFLRQRCRFYQWLPNHRLVAGQWSQSDIQASDPSTMLTSLTPFLEWWIAYEKWIEQRHGTKYRQDCYTQWQKVKSKAPWLPPQPATRWIQEFLQQTDTHTRPKNFI
ncbi:MAG: hypothetical protein ACSHX6_07360 [Akkermansiaceae bacterium]